MAKPPLPYRGGKSTVVQWVIDHFPPHERYVEPFFGAGSVLLAKPPVKNELVNDRDGMVVNFFRVLRDQPTELVEACALTPYSRDEFEAAAAAYNDEDAEPLERARRLFVVLNFGFLPAPNVQTFGASIKGTLIQNAFSKLPRFESVAARLRGVQFENRDAAEVVSLYATTPDCLIYCDPPYVHSSINGGSSGKESSYRHEMDDQMHRDLAAALHDAPGTVILSGYPSPLYDELYDGWHTTTKTSYTSIGTFTGPATKGTKRTEMIWSNRPLHVARLF